VDGRVRRHHQGLGTAEEVAVDEDVEVHLATPVDGTPVAELGEGPRWIDGRLRWVDILGRRHHALDPGAGEVVSRDEPDAVTVVLPRRRGGLVLGVGATVVLRGAEGEGADRTLAVLTDDPAHRCNDGACDPQGRLYVGTMRRDGAGREGRLHRVGPDATVTVVAEGCGIANGVGFDPARRRMYFADSRDGGVDVFDLDVEGLPGGRRRFVDVGPPGVPDGLVVDADGHVWVAVHGAGAVQRHAPDGRLVARVEVPVEQVTAVTFGGPDLTDLYVTTAREGLDQAALADQPLAGRLFVVRGAGRGVPVTAFAG
jgi:sugar lactone lactonase YvrE